MVLDNTMLINVYGTVQVVSGVLFSFDGEPGVSSVVAAPLNAPIMRGEMSVSVTASYLAGTSSNGFSDDKFRHLYAPTTTARLFCARPSARGVVPLRSFVLAT